MQLEARLDRDRAVTRPSAGSELAPVVDPGPLSISGRSEDELEYEVGQNWFAKAGILAFTLGAVFTLSMRWGNVPAALPSLAGYVFVAGLFSLAHLWRNSFPMMSGYLRAASMGLLYFATLRLCFFSEQPVLDPSAFGGRACLVAVVVANFSLAWRWQSPWLLGLTLAMAAVTALAVGTAWFVLPVLVIIAALIVALSFAGGWRGLLLVGIPLCAATYFVWAINDPILGHPPKFVAGPPFAPGFLLVSTMILSLGTLLRRDRSREDAITNISALLNCGLSYGLFLVHTLATFGSSFVVQHVVASLVFLGLAVTFWVREQSRVSTFVYAMTGYMALSFAIIKASAAPDVFVWLSLQSVVVVATAIWFRSRFIVVANFLIYVMIVLGYVFVAERETGISVGFGIVALLSARIMNWQKSRLELKTELMRNAYLLSAFVIFPYALYHLVPGRYLGFAWVGLALFYYVMNLVVRSQKFRWMGHATLLLTTLYLAIIGTSRFEPVYRVLSFLVLGTVLITVSLIFTRLRRKQPR